VKVYKGELPPRELTDPRLPHVRGPQDLPYLEACALNGHSPCCSSHLEHMLKVRGYSLKDLSRPPEGACP
jgi:hypothetical protein